MPDVNQFGHVLGFGRKSTKPSYFQRNDGRKELFLWEKRICGVPRNVPMISEPGAPWEGMGKRELSNAPARPSPGPAAAAAARARSPHAGTARAPPRW